MIIDKIKKKEGEKLSQELYRALEPTCADLSCKGRHPTLDVVFRGDQHVLGDDDASHMLGCTLYLLTIFLFIKNLPHTTIVKNLTIHLYIRQKKKKIDPKN